MDRVEDIFMDQAKKFTAVIEDAGKGGAYITIPFDVEQIFGKKRVKVKAWFDGEFYQGSLVRMGGSDHILGIRKDIREKIGKSIGDIIAVILEEDTEPRQVIIPSDLQAALDQEPVAQAAFAGLAYSHQKEYVQWVEGAKREQTRQKRIDETIRLLIEGSK